MGKVIPFPVEGRNGDTTVTIRELPNSSFELCLGKLWTIDAILEFANKVYEFPDASPELHISVRSTPHGNEHCITFPATRCNLQAVIYALSEPELRYEIRTEILKCSP